MIALNRLTGHSPGFFSVYTLPPNQAVSVKAQRKINRDRNLRLQYLAGMWLNVDHSKQIFNDMVTYRKFPEEVFAGTGLRTRVLRGALNPHP